MIDLYRASWPSIRRRSAAQPSVDKSRSTTLDLVPGQESRRRADTGPDNPARFLQVLVEAIGGKNLAQFFPVAQGLPRLIGVDGLDNAAGFQSFLEGFHSAMQFFILPGQPTVRADDGTHRRLRASALGVRDAENVRRATPRPARKFDEFMAMMPPDPATLSAALQAGASDGLPLGFSEALSALIGAVRAAIFSNDTGALLNLGQDFGSLLVALHQIVNGGEGTERSTRGGRVARDHTAGLNGPVLVRKAPVTSRAHITEVEMGGVEYVIDPRTGKHRRKRKRRA